MISSSGKLLSANGVVWVKSKICGSGKELTLSQTTNFRCSQTESSCKSDENGRKLPKWEENTAGKGEIACYEQFLLFP